MADQKQVKRLERSVDEWNAWRQDHLEIKPDFSNAILSLTNLIGANLSNANLMDAYLVSANLSSANLSDVLLSGANLSLTNLSGANLSYALLGDVLLSGANLSDANLSGSNLRDAILRYANLSDANLSSTDLSGANLSGANLSGTSFNQTQFGRTLFAWVDLSNVKELETATHSGPSSVDINTVTLPHDEHTRKHFLQGVGFTETQIEYLPSLLTHRPIEYHSLFISYASQDQAIAKRLHADLRKKDVPCWFAPHDLQPGTLIFKGIDEAIHLHDKLLLILSQHAVTSSWVELEVHSALQKEKKSGQRVLFPLRLDNTILESETSWARMLQPRHIADFTGWQDEAAYQEAFGTLLRHLKVSKPPVR